MAKQGYIPTIQEIRKLAERADAGDASALSELGQLNNRLAKRANERMRDIERKGMQGTAAYNRAKYWMQEEADFAGNDYFSQATTLLSPKEAAKNPLSKKLTVEDATNNLEAITDFLRSQTSTSAGEMKRRTNIGDKLVDAGFFDDVMNDPENKYSIDELKDKLMQMFDTDAWSEIRKNNRGGTNPIVQQAVDALSQGALIGDLKRAFKDFQRKKLDTDYIELWENWSSATQYYKNGEWHELKRPRR